MAIVWATVLNVPFLKGGLGVAIQETVEMGMVEAPETSGPLARTVIVQGRACGPRTR